MKRNILVLSLLILPVCVFFIGLTFTPGGIPNHDDEVYPMLITDKWEDVGSAFLFFGSESKYHISYKVQNGDGSWHYYEDHSVPSNVYRHYEVGKTYNKTYDSSNGFMPFCTDDELGIDAKKK